MMLLLLAACAGQRTPSSQLVGTWRLAALEEPDATGKLQAADATGQFLFSADGHVSVQVMYRDPAAGPPAYSVGGYEASHGTYRIEPGAHTFTFHVEGALVRSLIGKDLPRAFERNGDKLIVTSTNPDEHWKVTWVRP